MGQLKAAAPELAKLPKLTLAPESPPAAHRAGPDRDAAAVAVAVLAALRASAQRWCYSS